MPAFKHARKPPVIFYSVISKRDAPTKARGMKRAGDYSGRNVFHCREKRRETSCFYSRKYETERKLLRRIEAHFIGKLLSTHRRK